MNVNFIQQAARETVRRTYLVVVTAKKKTSRPLRGKTDKAANSHSIISRENRNAVDPNNPQGVSIYQHARIVGADEQSQIKPHIVDQQGGKTGRVEGRVVFDVTYEDRRLKLSLRSQRVCVFWFPYD